MANDGEARLGEEKGKNPELKPEGSDGEEGKPSARPKGRFALPRLDFSRKSLMFVVAPAALVLTLGFMAYFLLFSGGEEAAVAEAAHGNSGESGHAASQPHPVFLDVPDILVNVAGSDAKPAFLKLSVSLELEGEAEEARNAIEPVMPHVVDQLQTYLRELRVEDLSGSAAVFRLKEELLRRINLAVEPVKVKGVLFREMIIQ